MEEVSEQSRHTDRHTDMHVKIHTHTHTHTHTRFMHRHHTETCMHPGACKHTDLGEAPRDYINTKIYKETEKEKEPEIEERKREEDEARASPLRSCGIYTQI